MLAGDNDPAARLLTGADIDAAIALGTEWLAQHPLQTVAGCGPLLLERGALGAAALDQLRKATQDDDEQVRKVAEAALRLVGNG